jgi:hypothetical protein
LKKPDVGTRQAAVCRTGFHASNELAGTGTGIRGGASLNPLLTLRKKIDARAGSFDHAK